MATETTAGPGDTRRSGFRAWADAGRRFVDGHRGWSGLVAGAVVGALLATVGAYVLPRLFDRSWEKGDLVILSGRDDSAGEQRKELIEVWNALHPENKARIEEVRSIADAERSEMLSRAAGDGGAVDVLNLDVAWLPEFAEGGLVRPLSEDGVDRDAFLPGPLATCKYDGKLWALPFNTDAALLYRLNEYADAPTSWASMMAEVDSVIRGNAEQRSGPTSGLVTQLGDYEALTVNALEAVWAAGGEIVDDNGEVRVDSRAAIDGLNNLKDGVRNQQIVRDSIGYTEDASTAAFRDGRAVFMRNWPVAYREISASTDSKKPPMTFAVQPLPWPSVLGGQNLAIAERSEHPRAARALIDFLTDSRSQQILFEHGGFAATRTVVYYDKRVGQLYPYAKDLLKAVRAARPRPQSPHYALFSEVLREAVHTMLVTGADAPSDLADRLRDALRGQRT